MVAELQPRPAFSATDFEPTGSAVRMYYSMTAASIFFFRLLMSMRSSVALALDPLVCWHSLLSSANLPRFSPDVKGCGVRFDTLFINPRYFVHI